MRGRILLALIVFGACSAQTGLRDRYFIRYPFDKWAAEGEKSQLRWAVRLRPAKLSVHQRLMARIEIELDTREVAARRGRGELITLLQVEDSAGKRWRAHDSFAFNQLPKDAKPHPLAHFQDVFLVPGDYTVSVAITDSQTGEYSFTRRSLHVSPLRNDALSSASTGLPNIDFVRALNGPEAWFQPNIRSLLSLTLAPSRPVHVDVVMNMTPSERTAGSLRGFQRNMSVLVPALKILAGMEVPRGSLDVTLLDLTRQVTFEQKAARGLDWPTMRAPLADNQPGVIDVQSLAVKAQMLQFFRDQVLRRALPAAPSDDLRIVIVLSAPAFLGRQTEPEPLNLPRDPNRKVFYLRYRPPPARPAVPPPGSDAPPQPMITSLPSDDLEHALKPLDARVYTASTPEEFRKALAHMLAQIQKL
jgi:hypothetical protein